MKVLTVTYTDVLSGAGIAALRLHHALRAAGFASRMAVARRWSRDLTVERLVSGAGSVLHAVRRLAVKLLLRASGAHVNETLSANLIPTGLHRRLNAYDVEIVHLHWIGLEMMRIEEIARINRPVVWTLHDEWFVLGLEHYSSDASARTPDGHGATDKRGRVFCWLDRRVRARKVSAWAASAPEIVCPSRWLAARVVDSGMPVDNRVHVIPNAVPTDIFKPMDRGAARKQLGLPQNRHIIGAGAVRAVADPRKGYSHLRDALHAVAAHSEAPGPMLLVFGAERGSDALPLPARFAGTVTDDADLALLYAAMDVFVCPSRQENLPNTIAEALACGVPCVAYDVGGIPDLITHGVNGYLAKPFDAADLCAGILECLDPIRNRAMAVAARAFAVENLSPDRVAARYADVYLRVLEGRSSGKSGSSGRESAISPLVPSARPEPSS